ncbi:MAG: hypothetical protein KME30_12505 [Iphinoe sp. HA4291-MV1]|nr:hypothetical protein [Iphinoe sp. HA4291-MV1]
MHNAPNLYCSDLGWVVLNWIENSWEGEVGYQRELSIILGDTAAIPESGVRSRSVSLWEK